MIMDNYLYPHFGVNIKRRALLRGITLVVLVVAVSLFCDYLLIITFFSGSEAVKWMLLLLAVLAVLVICVAAYMFPLLVRYENTLRNHLTNSVILAVIKLPRTLGMLALIGLPLIILTLDLNVFVQTLIFWIFIGFAFTTYMQTTLLKGVFAELEQGKDAVKVGI
jgi:uncharacterized membrane protein YesL